MPLNFISLSIKISIELSVTKMKNTHFFAPQINNVNISNTTDTVTNFRIDISKRKIGYACGLKVNLTEEI